MSARDGVVLELEGITKRFGHLLANEAIDLSLKRGEVLALLGENGAGKTTLMSILFGHYTADAGRVRVADEAGALHTLPPGSPAAALAAGIGMVHQHFNLADNLSVLDNIVLGTEPLWRWTQNRRKARARLEALARESGLVVGFDAPVAALSVGEKQRVEILKALYRGARILILDEPTAVLTPPETEQLFAVLRRLTESGTSVIFISHKLPEVIGISDRVAVLRGGRKVGEFQTAQTDARTLASAMVGRDIQESRREAMARGAPVIDLARVRVVDAAGRDPLEVEELVVHAHEIVGIAGVSGNGQRLLAGLLSGMMPLESGVARLMGSPLPTGNPRDLVGKGVGRIPEDRLAEGVVGDLPVAENGVLETYRQPAFQRAGILRRAAIEENARSLIDRYGVRCRGPSQRTRLLSGGNIQKLILGRVLELDPRFLLADQPTRGLDVGAVAEIHERLLAARRRGAAILLISEDLDELMALADRVAVLYRGHLSAALSVEEVDLHQLGLMMAGGRQDAARAA